MVVPVTVLGSVLSDNDGNVVFTRISSMIDVSSHELCILHTRHLEIVSIDIFLGLQLSCMVSSLCDG